MIRYCDVAVPVPLDSVFTYRLPEGMYPTPGGRVLIPFRRRRAVGIITAVHEHAPRAIAKDVLRTLDPEDTAALTGELLRLGQWISEYYLSPIGEVFRSMLPLQAEFRRVVVYRITEEGCTALDRAGRAGWRVGSRRTPEDEDTEFRVLDYLGGREPVHEARLLAATRASRDLLQRLMQRRWVSREDASDSTDASRVRRVAVLKTIAGKLNANQKRLIETLEARGGKLALEMLHQLEIPRSTVAALVKRGCLKIEEEPLELPKPGLTARTLPEAVGFNSAQSAALGKIRCAVEAREFRSILLHGVTGSGKTAVYLQAMKSVLDSGRSAILLVPEIGLTPAVAADVHQVFGNQVALLHSALSDKERAEHWHRIRRGEARAVVGTRSAVFAPVSDLALMIVDEEQDSSYKQEETPRYHARNVAVMRAKFSGATVLLGSATPSLESYFNAKNGRYALVAMPDRVERRPLPEVERIDMRQEFEETGQQQVISRRLAEEIRLRLARQEQVMVLLNRRGYSPVVLCRACGKTLECANCAIALTHHKQNRRMQCHYCGFVAPVPKCCKECGSEYVYFLGTGSEKLEELLHGIFPQARIARLDRDTVRSHADFERVLNALNAGELDLVVGTQMIAKGHDLHGVTLVGVLGADMALSLPDFRAAERTFQLLTQVAGRAGRGYVPGKVILQTYFPDHYAVEYAARHDFIGFYEKELRFRSWMHYPPYSALANVVLRSDALEDVLRWSGLLGRWLEETAHEHVRVLGPAAAPIPRLKCDYRYHFILKSASRAKLNALLRALREEAESARIPRANLIVDVDALSLM